MSSFPCAVPGITLDRWTSPSTRGWGAPCAVPLATVQLTQARVSVHTGIAELVALIMRANEAQGYAYRQPDTGAYNCRANRNNPAASSWHSWGLAIDANWNTNPMCCPVQTDRPSWEVQRWERYGFGWGGDYDCSNPPDAMHTEFHGTSAQAQAATVLARRELAAPTPNVQPAPAASAPPRLPWPFPAGQYVGDIKGPAASHGGYYPAERGFVRNVQQWLIYHGCVAGLPASAWNTSTWADGRFQRPWSTDAAVRWHQRFYPHQPYMDQIWSDDYDRLARP